MANVGLEKADIFNIAKSTFLPSYLKEKFIDQTFITQLNQN